mgnify:CR=1 FL=1
MKEEITLDLNGDVYDALLKVAIESGKTFDELIEAALLEYLSRTTKIIEGGQRPV